jgi:mycofactocin system creatininase family protein
VIHELSRGAWPGSGRVPFALVPLGSTEQHGPHLPFDTDAVIASAVARGLAEHLGDAVLAPVLAFGASGEHQDFAGTTSIGHEALRVVLIELVRSVSTWAHRIVFVNGHGGNVVSLASAVPRLIAERHRAAWVPCAVSNGDAHAGFTETSIMLHLHPEHVDMTVAAAGNVAPVAELLPTMMAGGTRAVSPNGVLGDPTGATAAHGARLLDEMIAGAIRRVEANTIDARGCLADRS